MGQKVHEQRFALNDNYDKLTMPRTKSIRAFDKVEERAGNLIEKGGNRVHRLDGKSEVFYNPRQKLAMMKKLDTNIPNMQKQPSRNNSFGNLYRQDDDLGPDHYDSMKIANTELKQRKKTLPYVEMKKQKKRDFKEMLMAGSESYRNVENDNKRHDYLRRILTKED